MLGKNLVHFAAFKKHIGFFPYPSAIRAFKHKLKTYKWSKGTVQFPLSKPIPKALVVEMVKHRLSQLQP